MAHFITVANANKLAHPAVVVGGNEGVIRARYADAAYFYRADTGRTVGKFYPRLGTLTFQEKLGSMLDKVNRLKELGPQIADALGATHRSEDRHHPCSRIEQIGSGDQYGGRDDQFAGHHG